MAHAGLKSIFFNESLDYYYLFGYGPNGFHKCCVNMDMQFFREKGFEQTIPQVKIEDGEEISYEKATTTLRRSVNFFAALQADDGHWPAENAGPLYFMQPLVSFYVSLEVQKMDGSGSGSTQNTIYQKISTFINILCGI